ncbi:hypothetical protein LEP1GSC171_0030 [Leptospira santarosai str. HAI1380]|uniref:Uncharacterized protein n=2 Tax=Leptospira santarosai TaxID=28183 RepID=M6V1V0_9LEPT|nr:hypothetical protein LEP1GSC179_0236 [Leptospira santarosai str. MOR084]EKO78518.1 hypothetical protein LEP1GSC068_1445 [Leptospira sp. Fiocruz LV3954]EKR92977.1 hypothetical protein LEP1GSC163_1162 [Leptospira santarosai str. CBC379]EKS09087.1 hypothetical protein LEP1GSC071_1530 [Leptospira santarosai str. JET]EMF89759.1 hypothetical protein LEP1GSC005_0125 [Leptospira santarosai str. ST188]EMI63839.1 hypothetical protein LEP1GSC076_3057 [Leptospira sp. Fiocruz LV4135]EMJ50751.1 hypothet
MFCDEPLLTSNTIFPRLGGQWDKFSVKLIFPNQDSSD